MAITRNTNLTNVADLIFYLDAVNPKSYPGSGSTWYDVSGNNNHFTLFNTPTYTSNGTTGTYLSFNGSNQYARSVNAINFNAYSAVTIEIGYRTTVTNTTQILYETTGTGVSTATGGITLLMNANGTSTVANTYLSMWQGFGPRLFGFTPNTNTSFNSVAETFVNGVDSTGRQALINGTTAQFFTNTAVTVLTSATTNNMNGVDILVIGGGGAGGHLGGGGAGGHQYFTNQSLVANTNYTVTVGAGGTASTGATGNTGSNSVFNIYTSAGGGGGAGEAALPTTGGSGGGGGGVAGTSRPGAAGNTPSTSPSQGNTGGNGNDNGAGTAFAGGGGGGAGGTGNNASGITTAGNGGLGTANSITGSSVTRAAGGGGGAYQLGGTGTAGTGGSSIGGNGGRNGLNATGGSPNTGSGGGGNGYTDAGNLQGSSGAGGSGVVIIKYSNSVTISNPGGGLTFTTDSVSVAGYNITTFTAGTGQVSFNETRFANTWTYVASRAGTGNFFRGDIAYVRAWGRKLQTTDIVTNVLAIAARQPNSYALSTILVSDPSVVTPFLYPFTTFTFTSAGLCGRFGPTFATLTANATYAAQPWTSNAAFFSEGRAQGYQVWQPPANGIYEIEVAGARGNYGQFGTTADTHGRGAIVRGNFMLSTANKLEMVVGQSAGASVDIASNSINNGSSMAGGGGGSFVVLQGTSTPIIIAGGGGGSYSTWTTQAIINGQTRERPRWDGYNLSPSVLGTNPAIGGGGSGYHGGGGGGLLTAGLGYTAGTAGITDSAGGQQTTHGASFVGGTVDNAVGTWYATGGGPSSGTSAKGGFGGGGGGHTGNNTGGGGGGYSGGHGGQTSLGGSFNSGIGGGSYIDSAATAVATSDGVYNTSGTFGGSAITNLATFNNSNGYIKITFIG